MSRHRMLRVIARGDVYAAIVVALTVLAALVMWAGL